MRVVDAAIYSRLNGDATLAGLGVTGVFRSLAPQTASLPYVVFSESAGTDDYTFDGRRGRSLLYVVKGVAQGHSGKAAEQVHERIDVLLTDKPLTISGFTCQRVRRESDVVYVENDAGVIYQHAGGLYRIDVEVV